MRPEPNRRSERQRLLEGNFSRTGSEAHPHLRTRPYRMVEDWTPRTKRQSQGLKNDTEIDLTTWDNTMTHLFKPKKGARRSMLKQQDGSQISMFDQHGFAPINFSTEVQAATDIPSTFEISGMLFYLQPAPKDCPKAMQIVLDVLRLVHVDVARWHYSRPGRIDPLTFDDLWNGCRSCVVTFRTEANDQIIRATHTFSSGHLELSLPPPRIWQQCGLGWLNQYEKCCHRSAANPRPWLGNACRCTEVKFGPGTKSVASQAD